MPLKTDERRAVPEWLANIELNHVDDLQRVTFPLHEVLSRSLYYPSSAFDGQPVKHFAGVVHSFIYVDYSQQRDKTRQEFTLGFLGYHLAGQKDLTPTDLSPTPFRGVVPGRYQRDIEYFEEHRSFLTQGVDPFALWAIFDRDSDRDDAHGPKRFSLIYICGDGVATYQALFWPARISPAALAIIQPGTGFGLNYTNFCDPDGFFAWTVLGENRPRPTYLIYHTGRGRRALQACWPEQFPTLIEWWNCEQEIGVWSSGN